MGEGESGTGTSVPTGLRERMTEKYSLSRRKALAGLTTIGVAGAGAGLGTTALFSDEESFANNSIQAGELDLFVDYWTSVDQGQATGETGSTTGSGTIQGEGTATGEYVINDLKPGDSGKLVFCPKIVDNPAWLWVGSSGVTDYENGQTEPEADIDNTGGGSLDTPQSGEGEGELSEAIQVTVSYCELGPEPGEEVGPDDFEVIRELNNPEDYTLADLVMELKKGFPVDGDDGTSGLQAYPSSPNNSTQAGPCLCIEWELPIEVGNEIQSDGVGFDITFAAQQRRNNPNPSSPFVDYRASSASELQAALNDSSAGDVIALTGDITLDGSTFTDNPRLSGQTLTSATATSPTLTLTAGRLEIGADSTVCRLDIDLDDGTVMYSPSQQSGVHLTDNTITMSGSSEHGIRFEGTDNDSDTVVARNEFVQESTDSGVTPQGVLISGRSGVTVKQNQFTGDGSGQAVLVTSQGRDATNVDLTNNSIDNWSNGVFILENQNEIVGVSVTGNGISDTASTAIVAFDDTGSEGFENLNGEDSESAQETALEQDNSFNNTNGNVDVILNQSL